MEQGERCRRGDPPAPADVKVSGREPVDRDETQVTDYRPMLSDVGESTWSIQLSDTIYADADAVVAWWFHPDRKSEYLELVESRGALDLRYARTRIASRVLV